MMADDGFGPKVETPLHGITDEEILEMIKSRRIILGPDNQVYKYHESRMRYVRLNPIAHYKSGRW